MEILKQAPWSRFKGQNSVDQEFLEIVGNGKPTGSVRRETIAVSDTIRKSVQIDTAESFSDIFYAAEREKCIENQKSQRKVPVVECLDGLARITSKELAITHSVKKGILQNVCSTSPRVVADLVKSARMHIARLTNSPARSLKRMVTEVQWLFF